MTITLQLQPEEEARLLAAAKAKGVSPDDLLREALNQILAESPAMPAFPQPEARPIWGALLHDTEDHAQEEFAKLPTDWAKLSGHPKS